MSPALDVVVVRPPDMRLIQIKSLRTIDRPSQKAADGYRYEASKAASCPMDHFSTRRLTAERLREDHLADLIALHLDPDVSRYLGGVRSAEVTKTYLATNMAHWDGHGFGLWALRTKDGAFAGRAGIRHILVDDIDEIEIAYTFKREFWDQGFASEIAAALTDIGLSQLELPSLIGLVYIEHGASRRVLEKSGYLLEKCTTHHGEDVVIYRIER
jgi:RimJ/RimL family protein N-acetyltransferase